MTTMSRMRMAVVAVALVPWLAVAKPSEGTDAQRAQRMEQREARRRLMKVVGLSEHLGLDTAQALKLDEALKSFDERRRPLREQVRESARVLKAAADGDGAAQAQVDAAAQRAYEARAQLAALDREEYQKLSQGLPPQKKAKLALFLARAHKKGKGRHHGAN